MGIIDRVAKRLGRGIMGRNINEVVMGKLISVTEAARQSGFTVGYIRRLLIEGRLKGKKVGSFWAIDSKELERFLANPRPTGRPPLDKQ
jgi:excisionase family DNA binding protein